MPKANSSAAVRDEAQLRPRAGSGMVMCTLSSSPGEARGSESEKEVAVRRVLLVHRRRKMLADGNTPQSPVDPADVTLSYRFIYHLGSGAVVSLSLSGADRDGRPLGSIRAAPVARTG